MESETRPDEVKATLPDEVFSDWRDRLQDVLAKMDETPQDGDYGALMDELQGILAGVPNAEIAKALTQLAASQTPQHRLDALAIIDALWSVRESPGVFMELPEESDVAAEAPADAEMDEEPEIEVRESWDDGNDNADLAATKAALFNILSGCVADPDKEVRLYSVEVLDRLPPEFGSSLHGLVLTGNYEDAKVELLSRHSGSAAYDDLAMFFQALDDRDIMISELARQNIANTIGQDFSSASEAFEWWESNAAEEEAE